MHRTSPLTVEVPGEGKGAEAAGEEAEEATAEKVEEREGESHAPEDGESEKETDRPRLI